MNIIVRKKDPQKKKNKSWFYWEIVMLVWKIVR